MNSYFSLHSFPSSQWVKETGKWKTSVLIRGRGAEKVGSKQHFFPWGSHHQVVSSLRTGTMSYSCHKSHTPRTVCRALYEARKGRKTVEKNKRGAAQEVRWGSQFSSVQLLSRVRLFATPWIAACQASLSITNSWSSLKLTSIESEITSSHLILCCPLLLLPSIPPSITVFSNESTLCVRWLKYWSFSFSISPSKEIPGLISFRMDWLDLLAVQGTLKSLLQHHSSKTSILRHSASFTVQLLHPYMTTGKTIALTRWAVICEPWTSWCSSWF